MCARVLGEIGVRWLKSKRGRRQNDWNQEKPGSLVQASLCTKLPYFLLVRSQLAKGEAHPREEWHKLREGCEELHSPSSEAGKQHREEGTVSVPVK